MNKGNKSVVTVVALLVIALTGLLAVQIFLLNYALDLKNQAFSRNVMTALSTVAQQVEALEMADGVARVLTLDTSDLGSNFVYHSQTRHPAFFDSSGIDTVKVISLEMENYFGWPPPLNMSSSEDSLSSISFIIQSNKQTMVRKVVSDLTLLSRGPISKRLNNSNLDSLLNYSLHDAGIDLELHYGVFTAETDSLALTSGPGFDQQLQNSQYRARLFPLDLIPPYFDLVVHFPTNRSFLYKQVWPLLVSSIVFSLLILISFAHTIRTISAQRRLSSQLVGFINNMTHEFKTPISTVALACEAIARPDVLAQEKKLLRYNKMISDENSRMHKQVEKILQMAQLEQGDFDLKIQTVLMHNLITSVLDSFSLQLEQRKGKVTIDLAAQDHRVQADLIHLTNVVQNLVDNAIKYSPEAPDISISTWNEKQGIMIRVSDSGTGINEHDHKRVFEKFYRCPTGNRHDVKGFGLGLSYVKLMVGAHNGHVSLNSRPGQGTKVDIYLPLALNPDPGAENG